MLRSLHRVVKPSSLEFAIPPQPVRPFERALLIIVTELSAPFNDVRRDALVEVPGGSVFGGNHVIFDQVLLRGPRSGHPLNVFLRRTLWTCPLREFFFTGFYLARRFRRGAPSSFAGAPCG